MNYMYRVYAWRYQGGVEHILTTPYKTKAIITGNKGKINKKLFWRILKMIFERFLREANPINHLVIRASIAGRISPDLPSR